MKNKSIFKLSLIALASATLVACGGGGGGGSIGNAQQPTPVAAPITVTPVAPAPVQPAPIPEPVAPVIEPVQPIVPAAPAPEPVAPVIPVPAPVVSPPTPVVPTWDYSSGQTFNPGDTVKTPGGHQATIGTRDTTVYSQVALHSDVTTARADGWTGKGVNILVADFFDDSSDHGYKVTGIINRNAPGSTINTFGLGNNSVDSSTGNEKVVNYSLGTLQQIVDSSGQVTGFTNPAGSNNFAWLLVAGAHLIPNAVIVKAAGNESTWASSDLSNQGLRNGITFQNTGNPTVDNAISSDIRTLTGVTDRLLIVGALDKDGTPQNKANLAFYSNKAGEYNDRFLVANGCLEASCNANDPQQGTSFAAPRVASYAAIINHKFQGLTPQQTSDILLRTARTDTINGYDILIHGRGEASLSGALAPIGKLR